MTKWKLKQSLKEYNEPVSSCACFWKDSLWSGLALPTGYLRGLAPET